MKLIEFSVTNFRSITTAHKITMQNLTVLVGKNNEGKSNLLTALNVAMNAILLYSKSLDVHMLYRRTRFYDWQRDFPIQYQTRKNGLDSIFKLIFRLDADELVEFHNQTHTRGNEDIPITVKIGKDGIPKVDVPKRGSSSYQSKSKQVTEFISKRISFNYIQAVRTDNMAINALQNVISEELLELRNDAEYVEAQKKVSELEQHILDNISAQLKEPLSSFLPSLKDITIKKMQNYDFDYPYGRGIERDIDVIINDGIATSIRNKGDGIKSLVTLAILKERKNVEGASIVAIEEPESHLHSGAIHSLVEVITKMAENSQVIITTHNPLFVQQNKLNSNIIVDHGTARPAKNISEIRNILGVLPSDNLRNARFVLVVEGEDDKIALNKILPSYSDTLKSALASNYIVIKSLGGASNLQHDLADLKNCMCKYVVLLDYDEEGKKAAEKAQNSGLLNESQLKYTICNGSPEAEFEDCLKLSLYGDVIFEQFGVNVNVKEMKGNEKWSNRMRKTFLSQGSAWDDKIEAKVKIAVASVIPDIITAVNKNDVLIEQKSGFIQGVVSALKSMINE